MQGAGCGYDVFSEPWKPEFRARNDIIFVKITFQLQVTKSKM